MLSLQLNRGVCRAAMLLAAIGAASLAILDCVAKTVPLTSPEIANQSSEQNFATTLRKANEGDASAQSGVGVMYSTGMGVARDPVKAIQWWHKAADQGLAAAQARLGVAYATGESVPKDEAKSIEFFKRAAIQGHAQAQTFFAALHGAGKGIPEDRVLAYAWMILGRNGGDAIATAKHGIFASVLSAVEVAEAQRISSRWGKGQLLVRESEPSNTWNAEANWVMVGGNSSMAVYTDPDTFRRHGGKVSLWRLFDHATANEFGEIRYMSMKGHDEYDCKNRRSRILHWVAYAENMGRGTIVLSVPNKNPEDWQPVFTDSVGETLWSIACDKK